MITEQKPHKLKRILFPVLGVIVAGIAIAAVAIQLGQEEPVPSVEPDFHETAEIGTPLVVNFIQPATTKEEYALLYSACARYMESYSVPEEQVPVVDVTEDTFVDAEVRPLPSEAPQMDVYTEYDRAYFEDFLMVRYVSCGGDIHVVGARLVGEDRTETELLDQDAFRSEHFSTIVMEEEEKDNWKLWPNSKQELEEELEETGTVSEETFVSCVGQCILDILSKTEDEERVLSHFTAEGTASLLRIMQVLEIDTDSSIGIVLAEMGASEPDLEIMDRLYLRCELLRGTEATYLNLLVKMNKDLMIYDVDTI